MAPASYSSIRRGGGTNGGVSDSAILSWTRPRIMSSPSRLADLIKIVGVRRDRNQSSWLLAIGENSEVA